MMRRDRGFTLIEVLVALAIVALALTAIAASMSQMIDAANTMRDRTYASWIAQNKITEFRLAAAMPEVSTTSANWTTATTAGRGVRWYPKRVSRISCASTCRFPMPTATISCAR